MQLTLRRRLNSVLISTLNSVLWGIMNSEGACNGELVVYLCRCELEVSAEMLAELLIMLLIVTLRESLFE